jgi:hypothetical protein
MRRDTIFRITSMMAGILLTQRVGFPGSTRTHGDFWTLAYQAIDD